MKKYKLVFFFIFYSAFIFCNNKPILNVQDLKSLEYNIHLLSDETKLKILKELLNMKSAFFLPIFKKYLSYGSNLKIANNNQNYHWQIRLICVEALIIIKDRENKKYLKKQLMIEEEINVKQKIVFALGELKDKKSVKIIAKQISQENNHSFILECIKAFEKIGSKKAFHTLVQISRGPYFKRTRESAISALENIKW